MANEYLDKGGLTTLWNKIKAFFVPKMVNGNPTNSYGKFYRDVAQLSFNSLANGSYIRVCLPDGVASVWGEYTLEFTLRKSYSALTSGKILLEANHSSTSPYTWNMKAVLIGNLDGINVYGSDGKYFYISGLMAWAGVSLDKIIVNDGAANVDLRTTTLDIVTTLPSTYQTAAIIYSGYRISDSGNNSAITFSYSKEGLSSTNWLAGWNGYELRAISPDNITAGNASKVNGHTVAADVPSSAVFTDTKVTAVGNHYTPSNGTTTSASGATGTSGATVQVVTGITKDAAGHVTGITSGAATDTTYESKAAANNGTALSLVTTGEKYIWNNKGTSNLTLGNGSTNAYYGDKGKTAYDHSQSTHARTDATAVAASTTNGNIKINGTETTVYTHPGSGTNPHGTTKSDVGLGNVDNTADANKSVASAAKLTNARTIDGVSFNGSANIIHYGTATVNSSGLATVSCTGFTLATGAMIIIRFVSNSASSPTTNLTLQVNSQTAKTVKTHQNSGNAMPAAAGVFQDNHVYAFVYDGTSGVDCFWFIGDIDTKGSVVTASSSNGKINIDGNDVTVYTHPTTTSATAAAVKVGKDANGHVVIGNALAKGDVGLGNVENKSSATIRGEITSSNVTTALGYTPASSDHSHGNITNGGDITATAPTIANGDQLIINDDSASKITNGPTFDGSTTTKALTPKGTWETFGKSNLELGSTSTTAAAGNHNHDGTYLKSITSSNVTSALGYTPATSTHVHGNINNDGTVTNTSYAEIDTNDRLVIWDATDSKIKLVPSGKNFSSTQTTTFLRRDGSWTTPPGNKTSATNSATGITIDNHSTTTITGVSGSVSVTGVSGSTTASHVKSGGNGTAPTLGTAFTIPNVSSVTSVTVPKAATSATSCDDITDWSAGSGSFTQGTFYGGSFTQGTFSKGTLPTLTISKASNSRTAVITFSQGTLPSHGNDSFSPATHAADSHTHTAPSLSYTSRSITGVSGSTTASSVTMGSAFTVPNVTSAGSAANWVFEDITVPKAATSATTVPKAATSATTVVTSGAHTVNDSGHTHSLS